MPLTPSQTLLHLVLNGDYEQGARTTILDRWRGIDVEWGTTAEAQIYVFLQLYYMEHWRAPSIAEVIENFEGVEGEEVLDYLDALEQEVERMREEEGRSPEEVLEDVGSTPSPEAVRPRYLTTLDSEAVMPRASQGALTPETWARDFRTLQGAVPEAPLEELTSEEWQQDFRDLRTTLPSGAEPDPVLPIAEFRISRVTRRSVSLVLDALGRALPERVGGRPCRLRVVDSDGRVLVDPEMGFIVDPQIFGEQLREANLSAGGYREFEEVLLGEEGPSPPRPALVRVAEDEDDLV